MAEPTYQNRIEENQRLREENRQLRRRVESLEAQVQKLTALLEQVQRAGKRQAAPFSKGTPKPDPKTPGRMTERGGSPVFDLAAPARAAVRGVDVLLRRCLHIEAFSRNPDCLMRIRLAPAAENLIFEDGTCVHQGEPVGELHFWNEHVLRLPADGASLPWAAAVLYRFELTMIELAAFVERDARFRRVAAFGGDTPVLGARAGRLIAAAGANFGFERLPLAPPTGWWSRLHRTGEDLLLGALLWTFNPVSARGGTLRKDRCRLFVTRNVLLSRYGDTEVRKYNRGTAYSLRD